MENEKWKDIDGYEGMYQVSDLGRVRSLKYGKVRVLRPGKNHKGYLQVSLCKDGKQDSFYFHSLVAQAFIENDNIFNTEINHINEDKSDNKVSNLEYCDRSYNLAYNGLRYRRPYPQPKRSKIKSLYNPELSINENIELFKSNGIECCRDTVRRLRKDLGLLKKYRQRKKVLKKYDD